jgi:hypothetical protein
LKKSGISVPAIALVLRALTRKENLTEEYINPSVAKDISIANPLFNRAKTINCSNDVTITGIYLMDIFDVCSKYCASAV